MARAENRSLEGLNLPLTLDPARDKGPQLRAILESLAQSLGPGSPLPSERSLAERFGVARMTLRQQIVQLAADGILSVRPSAGAFVAESVLIQQPLGKSFSDGRPRDTGVVGAHVLERSIGPAGPRLARQLGVDADSPILRLVRLRRIQGLAVGIERSSLPLNRFPGLDLLDVEDRSLYGLIEETFGTLRGRVEASARSVLPDSGEAEILGCTVADPCLAVTSMTWDSLGAVMEVGRSTYRGDRYELSTAWEVLAEPRSPILEVGEYSVVV